MSSSNDWLIHPLTQHVFCFRGERGEGFDGPTHERDVKRKARTTKATTTATKSQATRRRVRKRMTAMKTTRWSEARRGVIVIENDEARTPRLPQMTTYLQTTTPANTVVFQITLSWWEHPIILTTYSLYMIFVNTYVYHPGLLRTPHNDD